ncbi:MAG: T9SS type A sorting domain-containing protein [Ignavibacteria bacterium]|nr:T9SS type A sorting domain-containing protein [Ignavibacteria bacterium]
MKKFYLFLYLILIIISLSLYCQENYPVIENVFIINIDGIRNTEGFESGNKYLRYIWDSLKPAGTIYTNFYNSGITITNSAHSTIISGVRQLMPNNAGFFTLIRPVDPGLGEYYRKYLNIPRSKVFYISGKNTVWVYPVSMYPGFGAQYSPTIVLTHQYDAITYNFANSIIDNYHPNLTYIVFAEVDAAGHVGDSSYYFGAIRQIDSLTYKLWKKINQDPYYAGKTTFIVLSDHGRHDDSHGGWQDHGDHCHGCRHVPFLAIGPNIKTNEVIPGFRDQIDVAPTVAYMLGFQVPFAQGSVMTEMFTKYDKKTPVNKCKTETDNLLPETNVSNSLGFSRSPSITSSGNNINLVYSDNSSGKFEIFYTKSIDYGISWNSPVVLFSSIKGQELEPVIASNGNNLFTAVSGYKYYVQDSTYIWILHSRRSTNNGCLWSNDNFIDTLTTISCKPSLSMNTEKIVIGALRFYTIDEYYSSNYGISFSKNNVFQDVYSINPSVTLSDSDRYYAWQSIAETYSPYWNIYFKNQLQTTPPFRLTNNDFYRYSYFPSVTGSAGYVHIVYGSLTNSLTGNNWKTNYRRYDVSANTFTSSVEITGSRNAYQPVIKVSDNGKIIVIWNEHSSSDYSIWGIHSSNQGLNWSEPYQITSFQSLIDTKDFTVSSDTIYLAWQDYRLDNWEIYFRKFNISELTFLKFENENTDNFELIQNYPNPFNSSTTIKFRITENSPVRIKIYDITGKENATLINRYLNKGTYSIKWDATDYPSGIHFYTLEAGNIKTTKKMILSR